MLLFFFIAAVAAMARKIKQNHPEEEEMNLVFGVDGSMYKHHPTYHKVVDEKLSELLQGADVKVQMIRSREPSARGAALVAAATERVSNPKVSCCVLN